MLSILPKSKLIRNDIESKLDEADLQSKSSTKRLKANDIFPKIRNKINGNNQTAS